MSIFTTHPRIRRKRPVSISGKRARHFMYHLYTKGYQQISHADLVREFIPFFENNEPRTLNRYLGRMGSIERHNGRTIIRQNRAEGKVATFTYQTINKIEPQKGLLEQLGYITPTETYGIYILHHERFGYFTRQVLMKALEVAYSPSSSEGCGVSKDNLCACPISQPEAIPSGKEFEKTAGCLNKVSSSSYRQHAHKSTPKRLSESNK